MRTRTLQISLDGVGIEVKYRITFRGRPPRLTGHPDTWVPAEPGEIVIDCITFIECGCMMPDEDGLHQMILEDYWDDMMEGEI